MPTRICPNALLSTRHCPHLGAHLGHGGRVDGESIRCPFHAWRFGRDGRCEEVPYRKRGPLPAVGLRRHRVDERSGLLLLWHSENDDPPGWTMRDIPEWQADDWLGYETRSWRIRMHVQELLENVPDSAHFEVVHGVPTTTRAEGWVEGPVYHQKTSMLDADGRDWLFAQQECWGLGLVWLRSPGPPQTFFLTATTPIDEEYCEITQYLLIEDPQRVGEISAEHRQIVSSIFDQTEADVPIWENKVYRDKPALVVDDGPLPRVREWARQFYPGRLAAPPQAG